MARTKISKIARDFNVALPTLIDFLRKKGITIEDNPNARVDDSVLDIIVKEYQTDRVQKTKSDNLSGDRHGKTKERQPEQRQAPEIKIEAPVQQGPKVVGHIDLDSRKPVVTSPSAEVAEEPVKSAPVEQSNAVAEPAAENKSAEPVASMTEKKPEAEPAKVEPETKPEEPAKPEPVATAKVAAEEADKAETKPEAKGEAASPAEEPGKEAAASETDGVFSPNARPTLNINVVGKIDLSAINQSTRPRRKSKEEKRNDRIAAGRQGQGAAAGGTAAAGDRKKRKRIGGKEKIDIEKTAQQSAQNGGGQRQNQQKGDRDRQRGRDRQRHGSQSHSEVTEEDVQRQVKETLARLTNKDKGLKKSAKWRKEKKEINAEREREAHELEAAESRVLKLTEFVTANDLASLMDVPVNKVIGTCMSLGVMVSINQRLDAETINIVAEEFGFETEYVSAEVVEAINQEEDSEDQLVSRPPIVTVMGHVDHGKTSLLDYIRKANVIAGEAGGITQHIGAYNVKLADGRHITFLDTPGHEAFTAMRARGAKVTDICIIIVAADDNVMPQTIEAINHASAAGVPIVFAINKIDKPAANPDKVKEELANMNYLVEEWGGKYQSQDISAKKGIGVEELMEKVLLEAEMLDLKANPDRRATGSIIESSLDKGRGYVATVLVQNGTLRVGDVILAGTHFGRIKAMFNERNQRIKEAGPSEPALILGLNGAPTAGDTFNVMEAESEAREIANKREQLQREQGARTKKILTLEDIGRRRAIGNFQELNIIVKGDVDGSIEALSDSLIKLSTEEIQVNVLHKAVGEISESDVTLAAASDAIIIGFQVRPSQAARREAEREGVQIRLYSVIYQAIEEVKDAMEGMLAPEIKEEVIGTAEVLQTYKISKVGTVAGCIVREGKLKRSCKVRVIRGGIVRHTGELDSLKRFKDDVKEVLSGYDCGLNLHNYNDLQEGDMIEAFEEVEVKKTL
ncbi:translation initiation factor IF-2 [Paramuribaculum intestinale]|uniref:Translation initiation factor IF-2 n=3 Tax=Paramuribaculum intestinale TaxID=2094151 RepID=A0A2V1IX80_9BACT|nr:translation initiation factor IF-2 [Paramuribaculum intestinale]MBJ2186749.1 translation initiation factor IF-2 [Muribaculaceae bacterium]ROS94520.1 translation initiation factor IF-2 [Muribaculaceae bacterium Isolate-043 (Harlan)]MCX4329430.1 translation initiation factor IF-2 [Paramuribaculum intestinale]PWB07644.1 translation initiation factor IF-2 [Paramuribaculum intestinale]WLT41942.1 translation initiation factor IF-2 [Paramuribaculum intestinale]